MTVPTTLEVYRRDRLDNALGKLTIERHWGLITLMGTVQEALEGQSPLAASLACLILTERMLLELSPVPADHLMLSRFRSLAVVLAERLAAVPP